MIAKAEFLTVKTLFYSGDPFIQSGMGPMIDTLFRETAEESQSVRLPSLQIAHPASYLSNSTFLPPKHPISHY